MRCLALAESLRKDDAQCEFVCRTHPGNLGELIQGQGFKVHALQPLVDAEDRECHGRSVPSHAHWLGADSKSDAEQTGACIGNQGVDWLIVDHYAIDSSWEGRLRSHCGRLMVIDDLADRTHECDLLIDQNLNRAAKDYDALVPAGCRVLAGPRYALIRPEFAAMREYSLLRREQSPIRRILVSMGGVDANNATRAVLDALDRSPLDKACQIAVVLGPRAAWIDSVRTRAGHMKWRTEVLVDVKNMAEVMAGSDVAVGAAGTSAWERCCMGLPTLTMVLADNQIEGAKALARAGASIMLQSRNGLPGEIAEAIEFLSSAGQLQAMQRASACVTDGLGLDRARTLILAPNESTS